MRVLFVIGGIAAIIAGIVVLLLARSNDDASAQSAPPPAPRPRVNPNTTASDRPSVVRERTEAGSASPSRESMTRGVDDAVVRDHRAGDHLTRTSRSIDHQQRTRLLPVALTKDISSKVNAVIASCATSESQTGARLDGDVTVAIANHTLTVTAVSVAIPGATGLDGLEQCIAQRAVGLSTTAGDQEDIADYKIGVSFRLP